jgi:cold shock CspA family protein/ribosome-associated translation inhibitor RaiA
MEKTAMQVPVQITFRHMDPSSFVEELIRQRVDELKQFYPRITACDVVLEKDHRRHRQGNLFHVRVRLEIPGHTIAVKREPPEHHAHEDVRVAVRDAFDAVRRQLEDYARRMRADVKTHEAPQIGRITKVFTERGYAFLETETGDEVYVHQNAVVNGGFAKLQVGMKVRYVLSPDPGEKGAQASTVVPLA